MALIDLANPTRFLNFAERALPWLTAATLFAFVMAVLPHPPEPVRINDKIQHAVAFGVLGLLGAFAYPRRAATGLIVGLSAFGALIEAALAIFVRIASRHAGAPAPSLPLHRAILDAIRRRDAEAAQAAMIALLARTSRNVERNVGAVTGRKAGRPSRAASHRL